MNNEDYSGAGIICYIDNTRGSIEGLEKDYLFLILEDKKGFYDYPKGRRDDNEDILNCALREANEEANIKMSNIENFAVDTLDNAFICGRGLVLFLAKLDPYSIGSIKVNFNAEINDYEHKQEIYFLTKEKAILKLPFYLNKSLDWAYNIIKAK